MPRVKASKKVINITISTKNAEVAETEVTSTTTVENAAAKTNGGDADIVDVTTTKSKSLGRGKGKKAANTAIPEQVKSEEAVDVATKKTAAAKVRGGGGGGGVKKAAAKTVVDAAAVEVVVSVSDDEENVVEKVTKGKSRKKAVATIETTTVVEDVIAPVTKGRKRAIVNYAELDEGGTTNEAPPQTKKGRKKPELVTPVDVVTEKVSTPVVNKKRSNVGNAKKTAAAKTSAESLALEETNGNGVDAAEAAETAAAKEEAAVLNVVEVANGNNKVAKKRNRAAITDKSEEKVAKKKPAKEVLPKTAPKNKRETKAKSTAAAKESNVTPNAAVVAAELVDAFDAIKTVEEIAPIAAKTDKKPRSRKRVALAPTIKAADDDDDDDDGVNNEVVDEDVDADNQSNVKSSKAPKKAALNATTTVYNKSDFELSANANANATANGSIDDEERYNLKISSWNVAGLRSWLKKDGLKFLEYEEPDIFCLQEIKCTTDQLPDEAQRINGYHPYWLCLPGGYAGVAIYSKIMPINVEYGINNKEFDEAGRIITAEYEKFFLINVYVPNSGRKLVNLELRMRWEQFFQEHVKKLDSRKPVIICGDMNVSHTEIDLANPKSNTKSAGFTKEEREKLTQLLSLGFVDTFRDLYPKRTGAYTYWTYMSNARSRNVGWRLDYFLVSERLKNRIVDNCIRAQVLGSDHCPITLFAKL